jgi:hypothetical protein
VETDLCSSLGEEVNCVSCLERTGQNHDICNLIIILLVTIYTYISAST